MTTANITFEEKTRKTIELKIGSCWIMKSDKTLSVHTKIVKLINGDDTLTAELVEYKYGKVHVQMLPGFPREVLENPFAEISDEDFLKEFERIMEIAKGMIV